MECVSKHTVNASSLRGSYKFKTAEVETITIAAGFDEGVASRAYQWECMVIQGRQLVTADLIQNKWPGLWEEFCEATFPGLIRFKTVVDARGEHNLTDDEVDCRNQAYVDWSLCETLLTDSIFHYYDHPDACVWKELEIFNDHTTFFMVWHREVLRPYVQRLQLEAQRAHNSIVSKRGGQTVLDEARHRLGIETASTIELSRVILAEMTRLMDAGAAQFPNMPVHIPSLPPVAPVKVPTICLPKQVAQSNTLHLLWKVWDKDLRAHFSPLVKEKDKPVESPIWEDSSNKSGKRFGRCRHMLLQLDAQVEYTHANITKVKDRAKAVNHVLDDWHVKMEQYSFTDVNGKWQCIKLTPCDVARCFEQAVGKSNEEVQLKVGKGSEKKGETKGYARDFLKVFASSTC